MIVRERLRATRGIQALLAVERRAVAELRVAGEIVVTRDLQDTEKAPGLEDQVAVPRIHEFPHAEEEDEAQREGRRAPPQEEKCGDRHAVHQELAGRPLGGRDPFRDRRGRDPEQSGEKVGIEPDGDQVTSSTAA